KSAAEPPAPSTEYQAPPRCPDELLASALPDWAKVVWLAIRMKQGERGRVWHFYSEYAAASRKSEEMVSKALRLLKAEGWIEELEPAGRGRPPVLRCLWKGANPVPKGANRVRTIGAKGRNPVPAFSPKGRNPVP